MAGLGGYGKYPCKEAERSHKQEANSNIDKCNKFRLFWLDN